MLHGHHRVGGVGDEVPLDLRPLDEVAQSHPEPGQRSHNDDSWMADQVVDGRARALGRDRGIEDAGVRQDSQGAGQHGSVTAKEPIGEGE